MGRLYILRYIHTYKKHKHTHTHMHTLMLQPIHPVIHMLFLSLLFLLFRVYMSGSHRIQRNIRCNIIEDDRFSRPGAALRSSIKFIGGLDISYSSNDSQTSVAALSIYHFRTMHHIHTINIPVKITVPYKSGFLAYREVQHYVTLLETLKKEHPQWKPQVLLVDGNGILHHRGCGSASHLGVVADVPTIGVAKTLLIPAVQARSERQFREVSEDFSFFLALEHSLGILASTSLSLQ